MTFERDEMIGGKNEDDEESQLLSDEESEDLDSEDRAFRR
jgi:hypothetical protein